MQSLTGSGPGPGRSSGAVWCALTVLAEVALVVQVAWSYAGFSAMQHHFYALDVRVAAACLLLVGVCTLCGGVAWWPVALACGHILGFRYGLPFAVAVFFVATTAAFFAFRSRHCCASLALCRADV